MNKDLQGSKKLLQAYKELLDSERKKDARVGELKEQIKVLRAALNRRGGPPSWQRSGDSQGDPRTRSFEEPHASSSRSPSYYTTLPAKLLRLAVEFILVRAEVAKIQRDWVGMEYHCTRAINMAQSLRDRSLSAWCDFNIAIAFLGQSKFASAEQAFEAARPCVGIYITVIAAEEWRRKLTASHESPLRSIHVPFTPHTPRTPFTPHTPRTPFTPFTTRSTPIDQTLFQGFESLNRLPSRSDTSASAVLPGSALPAARVASSPSPLRSRFRAGQSRAYPLPAGSINTNGFDPYSDQKSPIPQRFKEQVLSRGNSPIVGTSALTPSFDLFSPLNSKYQPNLGPSATIEEEKTWPVHTIPVTRRFSVDVDFAPQSRPPSKHSSGRDDQHRSNGLSRDFKSNSKQVDPSVDPNLSQKPVSGVKLPQKIYSISSSSTPSPKKPSSFYQPPKKPIPTRAAVAYPDHPHKTKTMGTTSSGSSLTSPQLPPPDLDENHQEFDSSKLTVRNYTSVDVLPSSTSKSRGAIPRDVLPVVRESATVGIFEQFWVSAAKRVEPRREEPKRVEPTIQGVHQEPHGSLTNRMRLNRTENNRCLKREKS